jgi:alpha-tubulin suppressor-like RCC1 family protein
VASLSPDPLPKLLPLDAITSFAASSWRSVYPVSGSGEHGIAHACAITRGSLYCWGESTLGAMGFGVPFPFVQPAAVLVHGDAHPQRVAVSIENTCLRMTDGSIQCAGDDSHGQLGRGADAGLFSDFFTKATTFTDYAVRVALAEGTACVVVRGGRVLCWGGNAHGELARGTTDDEPHPTPVLVQL